ncbi:SEP domain/UBX domain containing protein [Novymonas esmeraldas]|uniref:UBX domain-containing protein 11 n=1 Tax=Novymonas esmeraldas TaxID=1808958 RepID=A0AAW0EIQ1_9TRYP
MDNGRRRASKPTNSPQLFRDNPPRKNGGTADPLLLSPDVLDDATRRQLLHDVLRPRRASPSLADRPQGPGAGTGEAHTEKEPFANQLRTRVRAGSNTNGDDLVTAMAGRLKDLESKHKAYQSELQELHTKYRQLNDKYQRERQLREEAETAVLTLYDEKELLEAQLRDRDGKRGGAPEGGRGTAPSHPNPPPASQAVKVDLFSGDFTDGDAAAAAAEVAEVVGEGPTHFVNSARPGTVLFSPQKDRVTQASKSPQQATPRRSADSVDVALLRKNARILSDYVGWKGVVKHGNQAGIRERDVVRVAVYKNGICVNQGPFRPYGWALCDAFLDDLTDGFYPYEFKEKYPDGFPIEVIDRVTEVCNADHNGAVRARSDASAPANAGPSFPTSGGRRLGGAAAARVHTLGEQGSSGGYAPVTAQEFLAKVPAQVVTAGGQLVSVRQGVAALMGVPDSGTSSSPALAAAAGTIRHVTAAELAHRRTAEALQPVSAGPSPSVDASPMVIGDLIAILIRLPDGRRIMLHMAPGDTVAALRHEFVSAAPSFSTIRYELYQAFPLQRQWDEHQRTLDSLGVQKSCALMVKLLK